MKTGICRCGSRIFFNNILCIACGADLGSCRECGALSSLQKQRCDSCDSAVYPCLNLAAKVCNVYHTTPNTLCFWCSFTTDIPDLAQPENLSRLALLEAAKRRLLLQLEDIGLPPFIGDIQKTYPLSFRFLGDTVDQHGAPVKTVTGHADGVITININEADPVHRERLRVDLGEPQRTLIGHLRHEIGHYIDWSLASRLAADEYRHLFGDPAARDYQEALKEHYDNGPPPDWKERYVSAYASMHPWEDFAETVNAYLDIMAIAATACDQQRLHLDLSAAASAVDIIHEVLKIAIEVSEYNLDLGLQPLFPEHLSPEVMEKLQYVHGLRRLSSAPPLP